jgi:hypothetical protein
LKAQRARAESPAQKPPAQKPLVFPCRRAVGAHGFLHLVSLGFAQGCYAAAPLALRRQRQSISKIMQPLPWLPTTVV